ncbi:ECF transporter S component [Fusibacter paucivorans]|uniref:ECF transporter S component n=1 Tax=Fusibacter paucivorans TaxID=76009 RepID=A0ABS5PRG9_9FIRM|nr:ECF transporter S component [Fusibacter paucivorans]MBS7527755.1 ECF transporter S component [Fusibacter paucivorans]
MKIQKMILSAMFLALAMALPFLTGQIPQFGSMLAPMHIPVLLCGFICGWPYGLAVGFIAPLLRFLMFGMPPIFPTGIAMAFELAVYGAVAGLIYHRSKRSTASLYTALIGAMIAGRLVWGVVRFILASAFGLDFSMAVFLSGAFFTAIPGIIVQLILIPAIVIAVERQNFSILENQH